MDSNVTDQNQGDEQSFKSQTPSSLWEWLVQFLITAGLSDSDARGMVGCLQSAFTEMAKLAIQFIATAVMKWLAS